MGPEWADRLGWIAIAVALAPIIVAAARAALGDWLPMGDNAYFTIRSRDVLGPHHPLLGAWSSGSTSVGSSVNNLGPLQFDLLSPFTAIGPVAGTAIGVATVNALSVIGVGLVVRRLASTSVLFVAMAATASVTWAMGSELLIEPRQHHALILPVLCFIVLCWGLAVGDRWLLPWTALVASLLIQTHLTYLFIVPILGVWGLVALVAATRGDGAGDELDRGRVDGDRDSGHGHPSWRNLRLPALVTAGVLVVVWSQSAIDQVAGTGNVSRLLDAGSGGQASYPGLGGAARIVGGVVIDPTTWFRGGFKDFDPAPSAAGSPTPALGLALIAVVLVVATVWARRRRDRTAAAASLTALVALGAGVVTAARTPTGDLGPVVGNVRWLWPVTAFTIFALVLGVVGARRSGVPSRSMGIVSGALLVALTVVNLPPSYDFPVTASDRERRPVAVEMLGQLRAADITGPVLIDRSRGAYTEPYSFPVLGVLQDRGIEFTFEDDSLDIRRFGTGRADRGRARQRLVLVTGIDARKTPEGAARLAFASSLTAAELRERATLTAELFDDLVAGELKLSPAGRRRVDEGAYPAIDASRRGDDVTPDDHRNVLLTMASRDELAGSADELRPVRRATELFEREIFETVGLFLEPSP